MNFFDNKTRNKYLLTIISVILIVLFVYLINKIYTLTLEETKENHQKQQMEMAKAVSHGINYYVEYLIKEIEYISENNSSIITYKNENVSIINHLLSRYDRSIVSNLLYINLNEPDKTNDSLFSDSTINLYLQNSCKKLSKEKYSKYYVSDIMSTNYQGREETKIFFVISPWNKSSSKNLSYTNEFIVYIIDFDLLIERFVKPLKLSNNDFVWILDNKGRLIFHPHHEEMLFNSIYDKDTECLSCHVSFDMQKKMVESNEGFYGEYHVLGDEPSKIFAYVPINVGTQKWFLAISTFLPDVTSRLKDKFILFFLLGIVILVTFWFFVLIIYYLNIKRIRAEETNRNLIKIQEYQDQLNHTSRLASIGELVDTVAHEVNTPAGIISAHVDSILLFPNKQIDLKQELELIKRQIKRISEYTGSLLSFSKRIASNPEELDIKHLLNECFFLLNHRVKEKGIFVTKKFGNNDFLILADRRQIEQAIINIINNAIDAVNYGGKILVTVEDVTNTNTDLSEDDMSNSVKIKFKDDGVGIKIEDKEKIFDPFFSTKQKNGTGLGLSITKTIIQKHDGEIKVESEPGKGTTFTLIIPKKSKTK
jgi:signal transduction histidine kinase